MGLYYLDVSGVFKVPIISSKESLRQRENAGSCGAIFNSARSNSMSMSMGENAVEGVFASGVDQEASKIPEKRCEEFG
ncbi:hypothetical protein BHYA_0326g00080 [Botrytis hyacinthi]|uniref:Uncharacterized protein n=1 Tax=Botrytis hyacinthi TaxID=278943 RepID=A0A4Z1G8M6_9HELO|nr:hypothetical protein BHYA_0326g00080 [Botrytis hyacinthi]